MATARADYAVGSGRMQIARLRRSLAALPFPAWADGRYPGWRPM